MQIKMDCGLGIGEYAPVQWELWIKYMESPGWHLWMSNLFFLYIYFHGFLRTRHAESLCSALLYADRVVVVPDTLEESAGEVTTKFLISEQLASIPEDLVWLISQQLEFGIDFFIFIYKLWVNVWDSLKHFLSNCSILCVSHSLSPKEGWDFIEVSKIVQYNCWLCDFSEVTILFSSKVV